MAREEPPQLPEKLPADRIKYKHDKAAKRRGRQVRAQLIIATAAICIFAPLHNRWAFGDRGGCMQMTPAPIPAPLHGILRKASGIGAGAEGELQQPSIHHHSRQAPPSLGMQPWNSDMPAEGGAVGGEWSPGLI